MLRSFEGLEVSLTPAMPLDSFYCRAIFESMSDSRFEKSPQGRRGNRVRLNNRAIKDLPVWTQLGEAWWVFVELEPEMVVRTDAAELD